MRAEHVTAFLEFSRSLPPETTKAFCQMIWDFEAGKSIKNPYETTLAVQSQSKVRLALAEGDATAIARDESLNIHLTVSPSVLIQQGLELEDQQVQLAIDSKALGPSATEHRRSQIIERRSRLQRRITIWCQVQALYMPGVVGLRSAADESDAPSAETIKLFLPSAAISLITYDKKLAEYEWRLRYGLAFDCLAELRRHLLVLNTMYQSKDVYVRGQKHNTRSNTLIHGVQNRIKYVSNKYRASRMALAALSELLGKDDQWESTIRPLLDTDIRGLREGEDASSSEGRRQLSWIWSSQRTSDEELTQGMNEALRIEWCKARARAQRWQEECILLWEEMCRVIDFHRWQAGIWETRANEVSSPGARAYAWRQRHTRLMLVARSETHWAGVEQLLQSGEGKAVAGEHLVECNRRP